MADIGERRRIRTPIAWRNCASVFVWITLEDK